MNILEVLKKWDSQAIQSVISLLNSQGIVSDEDDTGLSSTMMENWSDECEQYLRSHGYIGGEIRVCGKFSNDHGAIYALYNTLIVEFEDSYKYLASVNMRGV
ncbi:MAG: hypothetical protein Q8M40_12290 [Legionella sp.]|nr:hypothetical protein [Legionella sp.]